MFGFAPARYFVLLYCVRATQRTAWFWITTDMMQVQLIFNEVADFQHKDLATSTQIFVRFDTGKLTHTKIIQQLVLPRVYFPSTQDFSYFFLLLGM